MRRIDPVGFVATQLGAGEVPNLCGVDDADDVARLMQCARDAEAKAPGGFQTGVNPLDLLGDQPIKQMAPSMSGINEAPRAYFVATRHAYVECIFGNVDTQYPVDHCSTLSLYSLQQEPRFEQPCTQDLRSRASQDTVQSEQQSLENGGLIYRTGSFAKGR